MEAKHGIGQQNEKLNNSNLEGVRYKYEYHPKFRRCDIEFEIDDNCNPSVFNFIKDLYENRKGSDFELNSIQDNQQKEIIELLLNHKPASNTNRPVSAALKIHEALFSIKIRSKKIQLIRFWNVPNLPTHFIGRETLLTEIAQRLNPQQVQITNVVITACHGLGGIGKTFLAVRYAQLHIQDYTFILWFNAENETTLTNDYRHFADVLHLPIEGQSPENIITIVKNWLQQQSNWLIIYDNAPDDKLIAKYRPARGGKVLITSRKESWSIKESLAIDVFNLEEARDYIVELTGFALAEHQSTIDELAKALGFLPLALAQACAYISFNHLSLRKYLKLYAESRAKMLADETMPAETFHEPVAVTWNITFKAIEKQQPAASALLESCAFLQGSSIPEFLLKELFVKQQPELAKQNKSFIDAIGCLQKYSMVKNINDTKKDKTFSMHHLVQEVIADTLSNEKKRAYLLDVIQLLQEIFPLKEIEQIEDYAKQRSLLPHLDKGRQRVDEWLKMLKNGQEITIIYFFLASTIEKELYIPLLVLSGHGYKNIGDSRQQKELLELALVIQEQHYGKDHPDVANTLGNLGIAVGDLGDSQQKKRFLERALTIFKQHYGPNHPEVANVLANLGNVCGVLGDVRHKKELLEQALSIQEQLYDKKPIKLASTLMNLGNAYGALGNTQQQKELLERALEIQKQFYSLYHPEIAITLVNLSNVYSILNNVQQQKQLLEQALTIQEQYYGKAHPKLVPILSNLGDAYRKLGDEHQPNELLERALAIQKQYYGPSHPKVANALINLSNTYKASGKTRQQIQFLEQALMIQKLNNCEDHFEFAPIFIDLGNAYGILGNAQQQRQLLEKALIIQEQHYGKAHPEVAATLINLSNAYGTLGNAQEQRNLLEQALAINKQHYGNNDIQVALTLNNLANAYGNLEERHRQKELLEEALPIFEQHYAKDHFKMAPILNNLGNAYGALGNTQRKKELLEQALRINIQHFGPNHPKVALVQANLGNAYGILGDTSKQKEMLEQALAIEEKYYGISHPQVAITLYYLIPAYIQLSDWRIAKISAERSYWILSTHPDAGPQHPYTLKVKVRLDNINKLITYPSPKQPSTLYAHSKTSATEKNSPDFAKALRNAANQNDMEKLKELLPQVIDVNAKDNGQHGRTTLHWAVIKQALPCIKLLLAAGADAMMVDNAGKSSVDYAGENPISDALFLLLSHHYKLSLLDDIEPGKLLRRAAHQNNVKDIKFLLKHIENINEEDNGNTQRTALHWAVIQGATNCVEALIAAGADPTIVDASGKTALDYAKENERLLEFLQGKQRIFKVQQK